MYIVYNMMTMQGIKQFKDRKHAEQYANKLNVGFGRTQYNTANDQDFYRGTVKTTRPAQKENV